MLGLAPLAAVLLADDGDRLPRITADTIGDVALGGTAGVEARTAAVSPLAMLPVGGALASVGRIDAHSAGSLSAAGNIGAVDHWRGCGEFCNIYDSSSGSWFWSKQPWQH